ncbi:MAG: hypothetical protein HY553_20530 [Elusimicrobia bacterium]|nr:hypothetical protein [Elusimicrobiota bacterium]
MLRWTFAACLSLWLGPVNVVCAAPVASTGPGASAAGLAAFQPAAAAAAVEAFFRSPSPDMAAIRSVSAQLRALDTQDPATRARLEPLVRHLTAAAERLAAPAVDPKATEAGLAASAAKLQALNYPELRNLLPPARQRSVGAAYWIYQTHLTRDVREYDWAPATLSLERKIEGIARALAAAKTAFPAGPGSSLASDSAVKVSVSGGDIAGKAADALLSAVQPSGLCEGGINALLRRSVPGIGEKIEAAKPLVDGRAFVTPAGGDAGFANVVLVTDAMRLPLRRIVEGALRAADEAGFTSVSLPALRTGWNFGFIEASYEEIVAETLRGVRLFEDGGRKSLEAISLVVHNNPRLQSLFEAAVARPSELGAGKDARETVERLAERLASAPINDARYGSENAFLAEFTRIARRLYPPTTVSPETQLLAALEPKTRGSYFPKNLAILSDDLYLSVGVPGSAADRYELGRLRARFGAASVRRLIPATEWLEAPAPAPVRGRWLARLVPGSLGRSIGAALEFISARDLAILGFPSVAERWARSPQRRERLEAFHDRLVRLNEDFPSLPETSIWELALELNGRDGREAADMLGGLVGQTKRPLRYLERTLVGRDPALAAAIPAFEMAAKSYYLLGELHEKGLRRFGRSPLYPDGSGAAGPKFWHFYGAAMVASRLARYGRLAAWVAGLGVAAAYEGATFPSNLGLFGARGLARGLAATLADSSRDVAQHSRGHAFGRGLAAGRSLAEEPVSAPSRARLARQRVRVQALEAFWKFWWEAGPPVLDQWRRYVAQLEGTVATGRRPAVRDPRTLFVGLRVLGLAVGLADLPSLVASDAAVKAEAQALFESHIDAGPKARAAFDRLLERAGARYSGRSRNKLRSVAAFALRESSALPSDELPAYYDRLASGDEVEPAAAARETVLADFQRLAEAAVLEANRTALPGRRILGITIWGSYAYGAVRVGSDLDLQVVTEDGRAAGRTGWLQGLEAGWRALHPEVELEVYSNSYLPPDRRLLESLMPEPYLLVSPYAEAHELLADRRPPPGEKAAPRAEPRPNPGLTRAVRAFVKGWMRLLLLRTPGAEWTVARDRSLRADMRRVTLSGAGFTMTPAPRPPARTDSPIYRTLLEPWSLSKLLESHAPVKIGTVEDRRTFAEPSVSVLNMPIKMPKTGFKIPAELEHLREFIQKMIDHEAAINPKLEEFYAYLTVDFSAVVAGQTHRKPGIHIDGVQGARYPVKLPPEHAYSASSVLGTVFYDQVFDLTALDPAKHHVHAELERQADETMAWPAENFGIYFWDSYSVHRAAIAREALRRTFVRVEFSKKIYDSEGDTHNPLFEYDWKPVPRPIPAELDDRPLSK